MLMAVVPHVKVGLGNSRAMTFCASARSMLLLAARRSQLSSNAIWRASCSVSLSGISILGVFGSALIYWLRPAVETHPARAAIRMHRYEVFMVLSSAVFTWGVPVFPMLDRVHTVDVTHP